MIILNPLVTLERQALAIVELRSAIRMSYTEREGHFCDNYADLGPQELIVNIQLCLALLRELHPDFYNMEHLHGIVESLD